MSRRFAHSETASSGLRMFAFSKLLLPLNRTTALVRFILVFFSGKRRSHRSFTDTLHRDVREPNTPRTLGIFEEISSWPVVARRVPVRKSFSRICRFRVFILPTSCNDRRREFAKYIGAILFSVGGRVRFFDTFHQLTIDARRFP